MRELVGLARALAAENVDARKVLRRCFFATSFDVICAEYDAFLMRNA